jgi:DNA-binding response OmpR family regulator
LQLEGFEVVTAGDERAAKTAVETSVFDAVIVDLVTPQTDWFDAIRALHDRAPTVPIIAIASRKFYACLGPEQDFASLATRHGAARCLKKPFMPRDLVTAVASCVGERPGSRSHSQGNGL